jgi:hypothetical protein
MASVFGPGTWLWWLDPPPPPPGQKAMPTHPLPNLLLYSVRLPEHGALLLTYSIHSQHLCVCRVQPLEQLVQAGAQGA